MKKRLIIIIAVLIVAVFTGCSSKDSIVTGEDSTKLEVETTPTNSDENLSIKEGEERTAGDEVKDLEVPKKTDNAQKTDNGAKATSSSKTDGVNKAVSSSVTGGPNKAASSSKPASTAKPKADVKRPDGNATLAGEVVSVNGRKVSIKIVKMPGLGGNGGAKGEKKMPNGGGNPPDMASSDAPRMGKGGPPDMASGNAPKMEITYTGETKTIAIPDGVSITKMTRGDNGGENTELAIGDVKAGDIMMVWFSDESQSVVEKVSISNFGKKDQ